MPAQYLALYAKLLVADRISLHQDTIYLGGTPTATLQEAEQQARDCVNSLSLNARGTVLPRVFAFRDGETFIDVLYRAQEHFEAVVARMNEANEVIEYTRHMTRTDSRQRSYRS